MDAAHVRARRVVVLLRDDGVDAAAREERERVLGLELGQVDAKCRILRFERFERRHRQGETGGLEGRQADRPLHHGRAGGELGLHRFDAVEDVAAALDEQPARIGELQPAADLAQQRNARLPLQLRELLRHRRGREGQRAGRTGDRPLRGERPEHRKTPGVENQFSSSVWTSAEKFAGTEAIGRGRYASWNRS